MAAVLFRAVRRPASASACLRPARPPPAFGAVLQNLPLPDPHGRTHQEDAARAMRLDDLLRFAGTFFDEKGVDYYVFGATAMNFWIPPRSTADLDAVLSVDKKRAVRLVEEL